MLVAYRAQEVEKSRFRNRLEWRRNVEASDSKGLLPRHAPDDGAPVARVGGEQRRRVQKMPD